MAGPEPDDVGELLLRAARTLRGRWREVLEPWELSPHHARALLVVARAQGMRPSELAAALHIAPRSATEVVDALVARDLVARVPDPADRRAVRVELTEQGQQVQAEVHAARRADTQAVLARLPADERAELARLLRRLLADG
ncbi:MarR family transcriptional regulator [Klenkia sp. LSe6-5]|uniref:MarR family transcriptional regulator n=1 Tax=Klenkia sesuvii TaxID=3103137 RepID=A0ABU8DYA1_9ACTN